MTGLWVGESEGKAYWISKDTGSVSPFSRVIEMGRISPVYAGP